MNDSGKLSRSDLPLPVAEFIALMALLMAMTALSIDIMLPSLPEISRVFSVAEANDRQRVVTSYLFGLAAGQLTWGPISDRLGRRIPLLIGLCIFAAGSLAAFAASSFAFLLAARLFQGFGGAAARTIAMAIVRDLFSGRQMARVMSFVMMVFIMVPVIAPSIGQALVHVGTWRWAFGLLLCAGLTAMTWAGLRLPETRKAHDGRPLGLLAGAQLVLRSRTTCAYGVASGFMFGSLVTYISSAQQIFVDVYELGPYFPIAFGGVAFTMALAAFTNSRLVHRLGMRRVSHTAVVAFVVSGGLLTLSASFGRPPLVLTFLLLAACFYLFGLIQSNFNAIAMHPVGQAAGMASSLLGFYTTAAGAAFGSVIGHQFNGTIMPLAGGFTVLGICAFLSVLAAEGWSGLFRGE